MLKVAVTSSVYYDKPGLENVLKTLYAATPQGYLTIIHGGSPMGTDKIVSKLCKQLTINEKAYPADWEQHGPAAGQLRDLQMLCESKPNFVLAVGDSQAVFDCIERAQKLGITVLKIEE